MTEWKPIQPGDVVRSRRGKDEDQPYVVLAIIDERFALVADGDKRRFDRPKRKNLLHLQPLGIHSEEVANSLRETGRVTNAKLRFATGNAMRMLAATDRRAQNEPHSVAEVSSGTRSHGDTRTVALDAEEKGE